MYNDNQIGTRLASTFGLAGKVAVITGAAQGLGRATAELMAEAGAKVVLADLNIDLATQAAAEINAKGGIAMACTMDVGSEAAIKAAFAAIDEKFGGVDILVNNVADRAKAEMFDMTVEQWDRMLAVTLRGTFFCSREAIARMKAKGQGGAIVNISSVGAVHPTLWGVNIHYDAAKAGVDSLTRSLASEFAADGIRVNSVLPGGIASEGNKTISSIYKLRGPIVGAGRIPMARLASPLEIAQAVFFLASPAASYLTGQIIAVDGGYSVS